MKAVVVGLLIAIAMAGMCVAFVTGAHLGRDNCNFRFQASEGSKEQIAELTDADLRRCYLAAHGEPNPALTKRDQTIIRGYSFAELRQCADLLDRLAMEAGKTQLERGQPKLGGHDGTADDTARSK
jgi:hypothetical protein